MIYCLDYGVHFTPHVNTITARFGLPKLFQGLLAVEFLELEQSVVHLMRSAEHGSNWAFLKIDKKDKKPPLKLRLKEILLSNGELTYVGPTTGTRIAATISSPDGDKLLARGDGRLRGEPIELTLTGDPLLEVVDRAVTEGDPKDHYSLAGRIEWQDHRLQLEGTTGSLTELGKLQFNLQLQGPNAQELLELLNMDAFSLRYLSFLGSPTGTATAS